MNDAGRLLLKRGQSIIGRVEVPRRIATGVQEATVTARVRNGPASTTLTVHPSKSGSFRIDGVAPGEYVVAGSAPGRLSAAELIVGVIAGADAELARPLLLDRPRRLSVAVSPAVAPGGAPWHATISRLVSERTLEDVAGGTFAHDGTWSTALQPARYQVTLESDDAPWFMGEVTVDDADAFLPVTLDVQTVHGRIFLGEKPLEGEIQLDGGGSSLHADTDEEGRFEITVPIAKEGPWTAHVTATAPPVERTVEKLALPTGDRELVIHLPGSVLSGTVVDVDGKPPESAMVNVMRRDAEGELIQLFTAADGSFVTTGLAEGSYEIDANAGEARSETTHLTVSADSAAAELTLVVRKAREVRGRVVSAFGAVAGAGISIASVPGTSLVESQTTDARGEFLIVLPPNAEELDVRVAPPGFAYTIGHLHWQKKPVLVSVDQRGGTIVVHGAPHAALILRHEGAVAAVETLRQTWRTVQGKDGSTAIEAMEPGAYSLCDGARCVDGFLPPFGSVTLDIPE